MCWIFVWFKTSYSGDKWRCYLMSGCHNLRLVLISKFSQNFVLETRMLCFSRHSRQKCRKSRFLEQNSCFSLPATKVDCLLIFWLPHLYNLLQPGIRKQHKYTSIHEYLYLAINKAKFALLLFQPSHCSRVVLCIEAG